MTTSQSPDLEHGIPCSIHSPSGLSHRPETAHTGPDGRGQDHGHVPGASISSTDSSVHGSHHSVARPGEDSEWGPSHPCYPHLNPHVPLSSPLYETTRIIRIRRDWLLHGDLAPTFSALYPEVLADAGLQEEEFRRVVKDVNSQLVVAFDPFNWRNILDGALGLLTGWIWDDFGLTYVKRCVRHVEESLEQWNKRLEDEARRSGSGGGQEGQAARFVPLWRSGYLSLDIQIPTPQIAIATSEADNDEGASTRPLSGTPKEGEGMGEGSEAVTPGGGGGGDTRTVANTVVSSSTSPSLQQFPPLYRGRFNVQHAMTPHPELTYKASSKLAVPNEVFDGYHH